MTEACEKPKRVLKHPAPKALLVGFGDSSMDLELRFWIRDAHNGIRNISSEVMLEIWERFRKHDIMIPIPRREIHVHNMPDTTPSAPFGFPGAPPPGAPESGRSSGP
jgi:small-conductance mechanosensitive channel